VYAPGGRPASHPPTVAACIPAGDAADDQQRLARF